MELWTMSGLVKVPKTVLLATALLALVLLASQAVAEQRPFNLGQIATAKQVAGWDIDVRPDGLGAPVGAGMCRKWRYGVAWSPAKRLSVYLWHGS